jgi:hypothetical protein
MKVADIVCANGAQLVKLPEEFHLEGDTVPSGARATLSFWNQSSRLGGPPAFFEDIRIDDPAFASPRQGEVPSAPSQ